MEEYVKKYNQWIESDWIDAKNQQELINIKNNKEEIEDRFYKDLSFGTGGMRGIMGAGTNRLNIYTIRKATKGLANYILKQKEDEKSVVIAYDSRNYSKEFAYEAAAVLNAEGIKVYIFEELRPTPELSFAIRELGAIAGIVITASHNPSKYNGYKVYWKDGGQIVPPVDKEIINEVNHIKEIRDISIMEKEEAKKRNLIEIIGEKIDKKYIEAIKKLILNIDMIRKHQKELKIVYTPLHGTGITILPRILKEIGFENVYIVKEQETPNGNFPTVDYPNPEDKKAFQLALELAKKVEADIVLATDPDADRLGIYVKHNKEYISLNGNMSGILICDYEVKERKRRNQIPTNGAIVKTIVSSNMAQELAQDYHLHLEEVLTGFKYIGSKIKEYEQTGKYSYVFGYEESYGCLLGTYARDKDGIAAAVAICEIACYYLEDNQTLWDAMNMLYQKYGYYKEDLIFFTLEGATGAKKIQAMMEKLRKQESKKIGDIDILEKSDYLKQKTKNYKTNEEEEICLPISNVLYYQLENDAWFCIRPSGTEPKIKIYLGVKEKTLEEASLRIESLKQDILEFIK